MCRDTILFGSVDGWWFLVAVVVSHLFHCFMMLSLSLATSQMVYVFSINELFPSLLAS